MDLEAEAKATKEEAQARRMVQGACPILKSSEMQNAKYLKGLASIIRSINCRKIAMLRALIIPIRAA